MHARCLLEIAGVVGQTAGPSLRAGAPLASDSLAEYWIASRCRLDTWGRALRRLGHSQTLPPGNEAGDLLVRLVEEITLSVVLARVVTGVAIVSDRAHGCDDAAVVAASTLEAHLDTKRRLRRLVTVWWPPASQRLRYADGLQRQASAWSDVLLARLGGGAGFASLVSDRQRHAQARRDAQQEDTRAARLVERLTQLGLRHGLTGARLPPVAAELNQRIGSAALGLVPAAAFDGFGLPRPAWMLRAERVVEEAVGLIGLADKADEPADGNPVPLDPTTPRWWV